MDYPWIAFTGHRPPKLGGYGDTVFNRLTGFAEKGLVDLQKLYEDYRAVLGMALGWDQAVAQACVNVGIPFVAAVPFRGQELKWPKTAQWRYHTLLNLAERVEFVSEGGYTEEAMQARNEWMVDRACLLVALWDGTESGTGNCVRYARERGVPVFNVWEGWKQCQETTA